MKLQLLTLFALASIFISCEKETQQPTACFSFSESESNPQEIEFHNCSKNASSYLWDFGDGTTSAEKNPTHLFQNTLSAVVTLIANNENLSDTLTLNLYGGIIAFKPNIYLYPTEKIDLCLNINFPLGGSVIESIPAYNDGWCVSVDTTGIIDSKYTYLFYESIQPNIFQDHKGWCVNKDSLDSFFTDNMQHYHFSALEINDFVEYWIPLFTESNYYCIYPQTNTILDDVISLNFSVSPDNINRLFYYIEEHDRRKEIEAPTVVPFNRTGFYVMEWGVVKE